MWLPCSCEIAVPAHNGRERSGAPRLCRHNHTLPDLAEAEKSNTGTSNACLGFDPGGWQLHQLHALRTQQRAPPRQDILGHTCTAVHARCSSTDAIRLRLSVSMPIRSCPNQNAPAVRVAVSKWTWIKCQECLPTSGAAGMAAAGGSSPPTVLKVPRTSTRILKFLLMPLLAPVNRRQVCCRAMARHEPG